MEDASGGLCRLPPPPLAEEGAKRGFQPTPSHPALGSGCLGQVRHRLGWTEPRCTTSFLQGVYWAAWMLLLPCSLCRSRVMRPPARSDTGLLPSVRSWPCMGFEEIHCSCSWWNHPRERHGGVRTLAFRWIHLSTCTHAHTQTFFLASLQTHRNTLSRAVIHIFSPPRFLSFPSSHPHGVLLIFPHLLSLTLTHRETLPNYFEELTALRGKGFCTKK